jgi:hypothetical protein
LIIPRIVLWVCLISSISRIIVLSVWEKFSIVTYFYSSIMGEALYSCGSFDGYTESCDNRETGSTLCLASDSMGNRLNCLITSRFALIMFITIEHSGWLQNSSIIWYRHILLDYDNIIVWRCEYKQFNYIKLLCIRNSKPKHQWNVSPKAVHHNQNFTVFRFLNLCQKSSCQHSIHARWLSMRRNIAVTLKDIIIVFSIQVRRINSVL